MEKVTKIRLNGRLYKSKGDRKLSIQVLPKIPRRFPYDVFAPKQSSRVYSSIGANSREVFSTPCFERCSVSETPQPKSIVHLRSHKNPCLVPSVSLNLLNFLPEIKADNSRSKKNICLRLKSSGQNTTRLNVNQMINLQLLLSKNSDQIKQDITHKLILNKPIARTPLEKKSQNMENIKQLLQVSVEPITSNKQIQCNTTSKHIDKAFNGYFRRLHIRKSSVVKVEENKLPTANFTFGKNQFIQCGR